MALSIRDILILDYFDGKPVHHKIPPYKLKIYGQDANDRIGLLYENGWIRYSRPQETVSMLPDKAVSPAKARMPSSPGASFPRFPSPTMPTACRRFTSSPRKARRKSGITWPTS